MKKFLYLLSAILFSACGNELPVVTNNDKNEILLDTCYRSEVEAINIAKKIFDRKEYIKKCKSASINTSNIYL